jgi:LAO/AO transport system kinase
MELADQVLGGDRLALAQLLTLIENQNREGLDTLSEIYPQSGKAHLVGVTGAPGTGKSTLVNQLALTLRKINPERQVGVLAVDPSSPFTGGAILGDRIRMSDLSGDPGVFIRSMASRGALGGLAHTTSALASAMDAAGFGLILIETVGAGQAEVDIASATHTTLVIEAPGMGDAVQALKAGILEIGDIIVVNKSDLPGADKTRKELQAALQLGLQDRNAAWSPPVLSCVATKGRGISELVEAINDHKKHLQASGAWEERETDLVRSEMEQILRELLASRFHDSQSDGIFEQSVQQVLNRKVSPRKAIEDLLQRRDGRSRG